MTGNHLMLLLFRSVLSVLSVCRGSRCRVQQSSLISHSIDIWLYCLPFLVRRVSICPIPAHNKSMASKSSCELNHISILLDPVINVHQRRSTLWLGTLHECGHVHPAMVWLHLKLEIRPIGSSYCAGFVPTLRICIKHIFSRKQHTSANWPCLNKALLSSLTELSNLCKCLCHS